MSLMRRIVRASAVLAALAGSTAGADPVVSDGLRACVSVRNDAERLACYDREMSKLLPSAAESAAPAATAAVSAAATVAPTPEQHFGLSPGQVEAQYAKDKDAESLTTIEAKVKAVGSLSNNRILIELDNGQAWRQVDTDVSVPVQPGDTVNIQRNALGSYWLKVNGRALRVKRLR